jgi:hypothetical protein
MKPDPCISIGITKEKTMDLHCNRKFVVRAGVAIAAVMAAAHMLSAQEHQGDAALLAKLSSSKHSLADGVLQAEKLGGAAISAKFEMEGDQLMLSVYTVKQGRDRDAEHNTLMELNGPATTDTWKPKSEVFEDKAHIARSAMHLTLMQLTRMSLADIIKKAQSQQPGTVYSAIPAVQNGRGVVDVLVATRDGQSKHVAIEVR